MRVVLREAAHAHQAVHGARGFVAVAGAEFGQAQRQVAEGLQTLIEHLHMTGAVHRLQGVHALFVGVFLVDLRDEHVLTVILPVAGGLPEFAVDDLRGLDLVVPALVLAAAHVVFEHAVEPPAVRVPEHHARRLFLQVK